MVRLMSMADDETFRTLISARLKGTEGRAAIEKAAVYLRQQFNRGRFNTEHAIEVFTRTVDKVTWASIKAMPRAAKRYREYKASGLGPDYGKKLAHAFKVRIGATDQRRARRFLRGILGA